MYYRYLKTCCRVDIGMLARNMESHFQFGYLRSCNKTRISFSFINVGNIISLERICGILSVNSYIINSRISKFETAKDNL